MAAQFHVAYSEDLVGAGIVAGTPWSCARSNPFVEPLLNAISTCMNPCKYSLFGCPSILYPDSGYLVDQTKADAMPGNIDATDNLKNDKVYILSGKSDNTVVTGVVDTTSQFYQKLGLSDEQILYNNHVNAGHAFITTDPQDTECSKTEGPYINDCDLPQAQHMLNHSYGQLKPPAQQPGGERIKFNQKAFIDTALSRIDDEAYVNVPTSCRTAKVHAAVHDCGQATPVNPKGCWDFGGYSTNNLPPYTYDRKDAPQLLAIKKWLIS